MGTQACLVLVQVTPEILQRYLDLESNIFVKPVWGIRGQHTHSQVASGRVISGTVDGRGLDCETLRNPAPQVGVVDVGCAAGFRERLLGDPSFPVKVAIECGVGVVTKVCGCIHLWRVLFTTCLYWYATLGTRDVLVSVFMNHN